MQIIIIVNNAPTTKQRQTKVLASPSFPFAASRLLHARVPCIRTSCIFTILSKHFYKS